MNNIDRKKIEAIRNELKIKGWSGPHQFFSIKEIENINLKILSSYKKYIDFPEGNNLSQRLENGIPILERKLIPKNLIKNDILEFSKIPKIKTFFENLFESNLIELTEFVDFRMNFPGKDVPQATGWHQDIETFFSHDYNNINNRSLAMWVSLTSSDLSNSLQFINGSHKKNVVFDTVYNDRKKTAEQILGESNLEKSSFVSKPGDIILIDPFVLHRSVVDNSYFFRFSIDFRYANLISNETINFQGYKIKIIKLLRKIRSMIKIFK